MTQSKNFIVALTENNHDLENFKIHVIESLVTDSNNIMLTLKARDVDVQRNPGNYILNQVLQRQPFKGKEALEKERKILINKSHFVPLKNESPNVILVFANRFEDLPMNLKNHPKFGPALELVYKADEQIMAEIENLKNTQQSLNELYNLSSSSTTKMLEQFNEFFLKYRENVIESKGIPKQMGNQPQGGQQMNNPAQY